MMCKSLCMLLSVGKPEALHERYCTAPDRYDTIASFAVFTEDAHSSADVVRPTSAAADATEQEDRHSMKGEV